MNFKLVQSLASLIDSLTEEERLLLETQIKNKSQPNLKNDNNQERPSSKQKAKLFRKWVEKHRQFKHPHLSDKQISREIIYQKES